MCSGRVPTAEGGYTVLIPSKVIHRGRQGEDLDICLPAKMVGSAMRRSRHGPPSLSLRGLFVEDRPALERLSEGLRELHPARILVSA